MSDRKMIEEAHAEGAPELRPSQLEVRRFDLLMGIKQVVVRHVPTGLECAGWDSFAVVAEATARGRLRARVAKEG